MGCVQPDQRDISNETGDTLRTQIQLAPQQLAAAKATQPGWDQLTLDTMNRQLFGTNGTGGYLQAWEAIAPRLSALDAQDTLAKRGADVAAVQQWAPTVNAAMRSADPNQAALLDELNRSVMGDLKAGSGLTPEEQAWAAQRARAAFAARGLNASGLGAAGEVLNQFMLGQNKQAQRQNTAFQLAGVNKAVGADPYQVIQGRAGNSVNQAMFGAGQGATSSQNTLGNTRQQFDPFNAYASNLYGANQAASEGPGAGILGGLFSLGGSLGGSALRNRNV